MVYRIRRTELASPASNVKMMRKALEELPVDEVFLDLEDAVTPDMKEKARGNIVDVLSSSEITPNKAVAVRINSLRTELWLDDLITVVSGAGDRIDCIIIPKVEGPEDVIAVDNVLTALEAKNRLGKRIGIEVLIETAKAVEYIREIAYTSSRVESLIFGPGDYAASVGMPSLTIGELKQEYQGHVWHYVMARIRNTAASAGLQAIDGPYAVIEDLKGLEESARIARSMGYDGKWVIHPKQLEVCNRVFTPTPEEVEKARRILNEYEKARREGRGAISIEGELIDAATIRMAERILTLAGRVGVY
ncbi:MAG TPA: CoA ester lyase [Candidatus Caldiarchaeum subterraneum]|uniref:CoA ester lyase n=1 Tax=Caldiarchaeum subterraneum TaxID=311458 RepID=A0A833A4K0_CALS0|nr:CoA ester lyase [Candidatus Caldarchaeum subterraneum]